MKKKILVLNGPNLNMLGRRQPEIYGTRGLDDIIEVLRETFPDTDIEHIQSNCEGFLIDALHACADNGTDGVVLNAGAYTPTSQALADAIAAIAPLPVIEVHLSNIFAREEIRRHSLIAPVCAGSISGFGERSYRLAVRALQDML